jgi:hypothetical protein
MISCQKHVPKRVVIQQLYYLLLGSSRYIKILCMPLFPQRAAGFPDARQQQSSCDSSTLPSISGELISWRHHRSYCRVYQNGAHGFAMLRDVTTVSSLPSVASSDISRSLINRMLTRTVSLTLHGTNEWCHHWGPQFYLSFTDTRAVLESMPSIPSFLSYQHQHYHYVTFLLASKLPYVAFNISVCSTPSIDNILFTDLLLSLAMVILWGQGALLETMVLGADVFQIWQFHYKGTLWRHEGAPYNNQMQTYYPLNTFNFI